MDLEGDTLDPTWFVAVTVNVYVTLLVRFVTVNGLFDPDAVCVD